MKCPMCGDKIADSNKLCPAEDDLRCVHREPHGEIACGPSVNFFDTCYDGGFECPHVGHVCCERVKEATP